MLFNIYKKELIDVLRDRRTLLLTVFLPILMMTAFTLFYEHLISSGEDETYTLAVDEALSPNQEFILSGMESVELVQVENPEQEFIDGNAQAAINFADDFDANVEAGTVGHVEIIGDTLSQKSSHLIQIVSTQLATFEQILIDERLKSEGIDTAALQAISIEQRELSSEDGNILLLTMLIPLILALAIGIGASPAAADLFAGEKERKTMEALLMTPVNRTTLLLAKFFTIISVGTIIGLVTLAVVVLEIIFLTDHLKAAVNLGDQLIPVFGVGILVIIIYSALMGSVLMITSVIGKTVKEAQSYATPVMMLVMVPLVLNTGVSVHELTTNDFMIPLVNIFSIINELIFGIIDWTHVGLVVGSNLIVILIIFFASRFLFSKDKWVMD